VRMGRIRPWTTRIAAMAAGVVALSATTGVLPLAGGASGSVAHADPVVANLLSQDAADDVMTLGGSARAPRAGTDAAGTPARHGSRSSPSLLVRVPSAMAVHRRPEAGSPTIGTLPSSSKYYHVGLTVWVERVSPGGEWGRVEIPYVWPRRDGWIRLEGLRRSTTHVEVEVDLSRHRVIVQKFGKVRYSFFAAIGASSTPTPPGEYFVTDRIPFAAGGSMGSFAFGISGIQPRLPAGWVGGNQLAIHGTNQPSTIGTGASAGCVRVSERSLDLLLPMLQLGTPVVIHA
jgi:lipoprotein-anchoring transpeptidase ErfK/SrfK